jgi:TolB-like protein/class 3 adenylate cyclase/Flp pilus assembly protein TadD
VSTERRLAAILFTDIVGSTAVTARSESAGLALRDRHRELVRTQVERYRGRFVEAPGDESLSTFESAVDAVHAALAIQEALAGDPELQVRIGLHTGETMFRGDEVFGDGVNIAARVRALAEPGQILASGEIARAVQNQPNVDASPRGEHKLKGVEGPVMVHAITGTAAEPGTAPRALDQPRRAYGAWITAAGVLALVAAALGRWLYDPAPAGPPLTSIAVLPFDDMSPGGDQKWLADGIAEELIEALSRFEDFQVPGRTSSFLQRGKEIREVGAALNVGSVVEGSVRRSGDALRVTAQLIRVEDGYHVWSARYESKIEDVFAVQSEIAREVAHAIGDELGIEEWGVLRGQRYVPKDVRAWELMRKAQDVGFTTETEQGLLQARAFYLQAIAIDPDYALAHSLLGWTEHNLWAWGFDSASERLAGAEASARRALDLDPTDPAAHHLLAELSMREGVFAGVESRLERAIEANPNWPFLRAQYAALLSEYRRFDEALEQASLAVPLDPLHQGVHRALGEASVAAGRYEQAIHAFERSLELAPRHPWTALDLAEAYHRNGMDREALDSMLRWASEADNPLAGDDLAHTLRSGFEEGGLAGATRALVTELAARSGETCTPNAAVGAILYANAAESDLMFQCLDEAIVQRGYTALRLGSRRSWDPYRDDPRFTALLERMNLAD